MPPSRLFEATKELGIDASRIVFEIVGGGYAGLNALVELHPDLLKVDIEIVRDIDTKPAKQSVFNALHRVCQDLGILLLAEGVETDPERKWVVEHGADLAQGYWWGRPESAPKVE